MNIEIGSKALITTDGWFYAPDGKQYKAVFGTFKGVNSAEDTLGIQTNERSTNWYVVIGNMVIAGCQIHYAMKTHSVEKGRVSDCCWNASNGCREFERPAMIYDADGGSDSDHSPKITEASIRREQELNE